MADELELVTLKTRVPREVADRLAELADDADRSLAAELRRAIDRYLTDARKDGRK
jgi:predicted DNA-binding protein